MKKKYYSNNAKYFEILVKFRKKILEDGKIEQNFLENFQEILKKLNVDNIRKKFEKTMKTFLKNFKEIRKEF